MLIIIHSLETLNQCFCEVGQKSALRDSQNVDLQLAGGGGGFVSSPVYICRSTLDAEKCFDSVLNDGLLYKLQCVLPLNHWLLIYRW